jgi:hypothetical protein
MLQCHQMQHNAIMLFLLLTPLALMQPGWTSTSMIDEMKRLLTDAVQKYNMDFALAELELQFILLGKKKLLASIVQIIRIMFTKSIVIITVIITVNLGPIISGFLL